MLTRKRITYWIVTTAFTLCSACNNDAKQTPPSASQPATPEVESHGHEIFDQYCASCHGSDGAAGVMGAANLQALTANSAAVIQIITGGKKSMPAFGKTLSTDEIQQVTDYVKQLHR